MAKASKTPSSFQLWFEEAWHGWIRPLGLIVLVLLLWLLYTNDLLGEQTAATLGVLLVIVGALLSGAAAARPLLRAPWQKALFGTALLAGAVATIYPALHDSLPGRPLAEATLDTGKLSAALSPGESGSYEAAISGKFKQQGNQEVEADFKLTATGSSGGSDEVDDKLERKLQTFRSRRGSRTSVKEQNMVKHLLPQVRGPQVTVSVEAIPEEIEGGLTVQLRRGLFHPLIFILLGAMALVMALVLDARLTDVRGKEKSYLTAALGVACLFAFRYDMVATPQSLVRAAIDAFFLALFAGGLGGWLLGAVARALFGPKIKKPLPSRR